MYRCWCASLGSTPCEAHQVCLPRGLVTVLFDHPLQHLDRGNPITPGKARPTRRGGGRGPRGHRAHRVAPVGRRRSARPQTPVSDRTRDRTRAAPAHAGGLSDTRRRRGVERPVNLPADAPLEAVGTLYQLARRLSLKGRHHHLPLRVTPRAATLADRRR